MYAESAVANDLAMSICRETVVHWPVHRRLAWSVRALQHSLNGLQGQGTQE